MISLVIITSMVVHASSVKGSELCWSFPVKGGRYLRKPRSSTEKQNVWDKWSKLWGLLLHWLNRLANGKICPLTKFAPLPKRTYTLLHDIKIFMFDWLHNSTAAIKKLTYCAQLQKFSFHCIFHRLQLLLDTYRFHHPQALCFLCAGHSQQFHAFHLWRNTQWSRYLQQQRSVLTNNVIISSSQNKSQNSTWKISQISRCFITASDLK